MRALGYFAREALTSLWRARTAATAAVLTTALSLFVFGALLAIRMELRRAIASGSAPADPGILSNAGVWVVLAVLALAAALTVSGVVRLAVAARDHEIEIMQLVGAPLVYVRGPFVVEGLFQGAVGGIVAVGALTLFGTAIRMKYPQITVLPIRLGLMVMATGMLLGSVGGYLAARRLR